MTNTNYPAGTEIEIAIETHRGPNGTQVFAVIEAAGHEVASIPGADQQTVLSAALRLANSRLWKLGPCSRKWFA